MTAFIQRANYDGRVHGSALMCDLCGEKILYGEIYDANDFVCLCINCLKFLENLPECEIKEGIRNYLG